MKGQGFSSKHGIGLLIGGFVGASVGLIGAPGIDTGVVIGALVGVVLGAIGGRYLYQKPHQQGAWEHSWEHSDAATQTASQAFLTTTFKVMGYLTKTKRQDAAKEIHAAQVIMGYLHLTPNQRRQAARWFARGKQPNFALDSVVQEFYNACQNHPRFIRKFIEIQLSIAYANGSPSPQQRTVLLHICTQLGFSNRLEEIETHIRHRSCHATSYTPPKNHRYRHRLQPRAARTVLLQRAYGVLGLSHTATDEEVKRAYRRLISRHHPDKLMAQDASDEAMAKATEATRTVKDAYELIKTARSGSIKR